jgi:hypothetical protein
MFKFMTAATARIVLANWRLRWSTPRTFNDPFDVQFDLRIDIDRREVRRLALEKMWADLYGPEPGPPANQSGMLIRVMRGRMPAWNLEQLEANMGVHSTKASMGATRSCRAFKPRRANTSGIAKSSV